jgi:hypothetical protein
VATVERLAPDRKEIAEREGPVHWRLDVNESVRRVGVQPINASRGLRNPDVCWNVDQLAAVVDHEMLMDVDPLTFAGIACDSVDGAARELGELGRERSAVASSSSRVSMRRMG